MLSPCLVGRETLGEELIAEENSKDPAALLLSPTEALAKEGTASLQLGTGAWSRAAGKHDLMPWAEQEEVPLVHK